MYQNMILFLLYICVFLWQAESLHTHIGKSMTECFSIDAPAYKHGISLNYDTLKGVSESMEVLLTDGSETIIFRQKGPSGRYTEPVGRSGKHSVCFLNVENSVGDIVVGFSFHADDPQHDVLSNADATKIQQVQAMEDMVYDLSVKLDTVKDTQSYLKTIKQNQHDVLESTQTRLVLWSTIEAIVLMIVAYLQVSYLRRTLEVRRSL